MWILLLLIIFGVIGVLWRQRYLQKRRQQTLRQLRRWLGENAALDLELQRWMSGLSTKETEVLLDLLEGYCTSLNWELSWLFTPYLQKTPVLKQALEEGVIAYACSILASLQLVDDVYLYKTYVALAQKPKERKQFVLIRKLYKKLGEKGALVAADTKRSWWRRQPSKHQQITAVMRVFDQDPALAMVTLKTLLIDEAEATVRQVADIMPLPVPA